MSNEMMEQLAKISNELWNDNLWYRQLDGESKIAVSHTVYLMRNHTRIKAPRRFAEVLNKELSQMITKWESRG